MLYKLVAGVSDMELQEEMLIKSDLTLTEAVQGELQVQPGSHEW